MSDENTNYLEALYTVIYGGGPLACPTCGTPLRRIPSQQIGAFGYAECHTCGTSELVSRQNDPKRDQFRPYTLEEKLAIVQRYDSGETPTCPSDGAAMEGSVKSIGGGQEQVFVQCPRCGYSANMGRPRGG